MPANELTLKSIEELKGYSFVIPSYQRGYRWGKDQVNDLINDINEFAQTRKDALPNDFYCLQPIVLKAVALDGKTLDCLPPEAKIESGVLRLRPSKKEESEQSDVIEYRYSPEKKKFIATNRFEVIDGQQRLTTIFLILNALGEQPCDLSYETREDTTTALTAPEKASDERIDQWHIKQSWKIISQHKALKDEIWKKTFLNHTKVIWYEPENLSSDKDSIEIFSRINRGKIPLTNSELIRALFILETKKKKSREFNEYKIAAEWDFIEQQLHNNEFWCFCKLDNPFGKKEYPNRIEFFFDLIDARNPEENTHQTYSTFNMYAKKLKDGETVEQLWQEVKNLYYRLHEWFIDDDLYHLIGFVRFNNWKPILGLLSDANNKKQSTILKELLKLIKEKVNPEEMNNWYYGKDNDQIQNALLLFNLFSYEKEGRHFPWQYYLFKPNGDRRTWSLEHINAQNQQELKGVKWLDWAAKTTKQIEEDLDLKHSKELLKELKEILEGLNNDTLDSRLPKNRFSKVLNKLQGDIQDHKHCIENLSLLDRDDNSSLNNSIFSQKRKKIREFCKDSNHFIPLATRDVFMKGYSNGIVSMDKWEVSDCTSYYKAIAEAFNENLPDLKISTELPKRGDENNE